MHMSSESLLVILFVGLVAGWLAGQIVQGTGFGMIGDIIVEILGAFVGSWLLPRLGIHLGTGLISAIVNAPPSVPFCFCSSCASFEAAAGGGGKGAGGVDRQLRRSRRARGWFRNNVAINDATRHQLTARA